MPAFNYEKTLQVFNNKLQKFLSDRRTIDDGRVHPTTEDMDALHKLLDLLLKLKFDEDYEGRSPVRYQLEDRNLYQPAYFIPIPHFHLVPIEQTDGVLKDIALNVNQAASQLDNFQKLLRLSKQQKSTHLG